MSEFPPRDIKPIVQEVAQLLKERGESVSVAETVCLASTLSHIHACMLTMTIGRRRHHIRLNLKHARSKQDLQRRADIIYFA